MTIEGKTGWRSPANIALVKYWGKKGFQLPGNPSVSMTLTNCHTETVIEYEQKNSYAGLSFRFSFNGIRDTLFEKKISRFLKIVTEELPALNNLHLNIETKNSFPHSAGIASSASSISSLALCLCQVDQKLSGNEPDSKKFFRKASQLARLGSGSASRSVYGGWVLWGETPGIENSSNDYAIPLSKIVHKDFDLYYDAILIVDSTEKKVKSSSGHRLMDSNPYKDIRGKTAESNTLKLIESLKNGNQNIFREIVEYETANLHAMFLTSNPYYILIKPETLQIINKLTEFRKKTNLGFSISLDAGPNIHLLYPENTRDIMLGFIKSELISFCENQMWIDDRIGDGPQLINL